MIGLPCVVGASWTWACGGHPSGSSSWLRISHACFDIDVRVPTSSVCRAPAGPEAFGLNSVIPAQAERSGRPESPRLGDSDRELSTPHRPGQRFTASH
jgi:hypothetical protein